MVALVALSMPDTWKNYVITRKSLPCEKTHDLISLVMWKHFVCLKMRTTRAIKCVETEEPKSVSLPWRSSLLSENSSAKSIFCVLKENPFSHFMVKQQHHEIPVSNVIAACSI